MKIYKKEWGREDDPVGMIINATISDDGSSRTDGTDYGASARGYDGRDDYEHGLHINADDVPAFTLELLKRSFNLRGRITFLIIQKIRKNSNTDIQDRYPKGQADVNKKQCK